MVAMSGEKLIVFDVKYTLEMRPDGAVVGDTVAVGVGATNVCC